MRITRRLVGPTVVLTVLCACAPTVQQEIALGNQYATEIEQTMPLLEDPEAMAAFRRVVVPLERVAERQNLDWEFRVVNSDQVNAFAVPGGHIYVMRGLIERSNGYDELAGAIAHEIGHVDLRHSAEQMGKASAANTGVSLAYLLLGREPSAAEAVALNVAGGAVFAKFSRDDEREADSVAVGYLTEARINPGGLIGMFETLRDIGQREPSKVEQWFASHPMPEERIANVRRIIDHSPRARALLQSGRQELDAYRELKRRLAALPPAPTELPQS